MWISDFVRLIFPSRCYACGKSMISGEEMICTGCYFNLPRTNFHLYDDNPVSRIFWCRANLYSATSFLFFNKGGNVQKLMHQLKYQSRTEIGIFLGQLFGNELKKSPLFQNVNIILPVPLHTKKLRTRGFNQSEIISQGICQSMDTKLCNEILLRKVFTSTQTKKSRYSRWENVAGKFEIKNPDIIEGKHLLLVDDVLTTGATIEACAEEILKVPNVKLSVATLAYALV